jgi:phospholipase/carboxylesterase
MRAAERRHRSLQYNSAVLKYVKSVPSGAGDDAELPLVIVMHGRGADANDLADVAPYLDHGYRFLFPNAPKPFEMYAGMSFGFTWFDGWPAERESFEASRKLVLEFLDQALEQYPTPPGKVIVCGFSQGGMMALDAGFRTERPIAGIVCMSAAINEEDLPPFKSIPVLVVHGSEDEVVRVIEARRTRAILEEHGIDTAYHEFPMGHHVTDESLQTVKDFMAARLL